MKPTEIGGVKIKKNMKIENKKIEQIVKRVLCKRLKKRLYDDRLPLAENIARFEWVYNSPLDQWEDRIWVVTKCHRAIGEKGLTRCLEEYLYSR